MDFLNNPTLINSAIGAAIGFVVAQLVNLAKLFWWWLWRPILEIEPIGENNQLLSHSVQSGPHGAFLASYEYGFYVRNRGWGIAPDVRFQLLSIDIRDRDSAEFRTVLSATANLSTYTAADAERGEAQATIVPDASVAVHLAWWREDENAICPAIKVAGDYYSEMCQDAVEFRFKVVAFARDIRHVIKVLTIRYPYHERQNAISKASLGLQG